MYRHAYNYRLIHYIIVHGSQQKVRWPLRFVSSHAPLVAQYYKYVKTSLCEAPGESGNMYPND